MTHSSVHFVTSANFSGILKILRFESLKLKIFLLTSFWRVYLECWQRKKSLFVFKNGDQLFGIGYHFENLGAKWLREKKVNFMPCIVQCVSSWCYMAGLDISLSGLYLVQGKASCNFLLVEETIWVWGQATCGAVSVMFFLSVLVFCFWSRISQYLNEVFVANQISVPCPHHRWVSCTCKIDIIT